MRETRSPIECGKPAVPLNKSLSEESENKSCRFQKNDSEQTGFFSAGNLADTETTPQQQEKSRRLYDQVRTRFPQKVNLRRLKLKSWAAEYAELQRKSDDPAFVDEVFEWYLKNMGCDYVPEAFCMRTFRLKFDNIVSAREREERQINGKSYKNGRLPPGEYKRRFYAGELNYGRDHYSIEKDEFGRRYDENYNTHVSDHDEVGWSDN